MKLTLSALAAILATASATALDLEKRDSPLSVSLAQVEDSKVKVALTNNDATSYKLFYKGTFLDHAPTDKLSVTSDCKYYPSGNISPSMYLLL
jgi:deuterolysin